MPKPPAITHVGDSSYNFRFWIEEVKIENYSGSAFHREDGPAKEWTIAGYKEYHKYGEPCQSLLI